MMNALTFYQPYGQLVILGLKGNETRGWYTNIRGRVAVHAGKKYPSSIYEMLVNAGDEKTLFAIYDALETAGYDPNDDADLPLGAVIGTVEIVECAKVVRRTYDSAVLESGRIITGRELLFGDYRPERYAWKLRNPEMFKTPVPARGHQGFWKWDERQGGMSHDR